MSSSGEHQGSDNPFPLPEYIRVADKAVAEIADTAVLAASEKGMVLAEFSTYRTLTPEEEKIHRVVDPVIQKTFDIPFVGERAVGAGLKLACETKKGIPNYTVSFGLDVRGFNHSATHDHIFHQGITIYTIHPDGNVTYWKNKESREEREDASVDEATGLKVLSPGFFVIGQMMDIKAGLNQLNDAEKQRLYQLASEHELEVVDDQTLVQAIQETLQSQGTSTYELVAVERNPEPSTWIEGYLESRDGRYQVQVEMLPTGEKILRYKVKSENRFMVALDSSGQIQLAEVYLEQDSTVLTELEHQRHEQEDRDLSEKGFAVFSPVKTLIEASRKYSKARDQERQAGLLVPSEEEFNEYLGKIKQVIAIYQ